jgi:hypothetical protein
MSFLTDRFRALVCALATGAVLCAPQLGYAQVVGYVEPSSVLTDLRVVVTAPTANSSWTAVSAQASGPKVVKDIMMNGPGGRQVANQVSETMTKRAAIIAGAKIASRAAGVIGAGVLLYDVYDYYRARPKTTAPAENLMWDPGQNQTTSSVLQYRVCGPGNSCSVLGWTTSMDAACQNFATWVHVGYTYQLYAPNDCWAKSGATYVQEAFGSSQTNNVTQCPLSVGYDETIAAGAPVGPDGKCRTGSYTQALTPEQMADKQAAYDAGHLSDQQYADLVNQALGREPIALDPSGIEVGNSVPFITGPVTTSTQTNPDGSTVNTQTATGWNFARDPLRKAEGTYVPATTTTVTTCPAGGGTCSTTSTASSTSGTTGRDSASTVKIDESGTPTYTAPSTAPITDVRDAQAGKINDTLSPVVDPGFGFLGAPALATCTPFVLPNSMGSIDPCDQVETVRTIMAYLWALGGTWLCFGMVRRTLAG